MAAAPSSDAVALPREQRQRHNELLLARLLHQLLQPSQISAVAMRAFPMISAQTLHALATGSPRGESALHHLRRRARSCRGARRRQCIYAIRYINIPGCDESASITLQSGHCTSVVKCSRAAPRRRPVHMRPPPGGGARANATRPPTRNFGGYP